MRLKTNIMGIFAGFFSGKKNNTNKNSGLDLESSQLINSAPVESLFYDLNPDKKPAPKESQVVTEKIDFPKVKTASPFNTDIISPAPEKKVELPLTESIPPEPSISFDLPSLAPKQEEVFENKNVYQPESVSPFDPKENIQILEIDPETPSNPQDFIKTLKANPEVKSPKAIPPKGNSHGGKIFAFIFSIIIILALAGGGYYFFIFRDSLNKEPIETEIIPPVISEIVSPEVIPEKKSNPKYLNLDWQPTISSQKIIEEIKKRLNEFMASGQTGTEEYVIVDMQNNPIIFKELASKLLGQNFPNSILSLIGDETRLLFYNDNGNPGIGFILKSQDDISLKAEMVKEEINLIGYLTPLLSIIQVPATQKEAPVFKTSTYKDIETRYYNIPSPDKLSLDYIIAKNTLIFGTTKATIRSIYDLTQTEKTTTQETNTPISIENAVPQENIPQSNVPQQ